MRTVMQFRFALCLAMSAVAGALLACAAAVWGVRRLRLGAILREE